ncbi:MAG: alanine racemase [Planctomycetota bacterium]
MEHRVWAEISRSRLEANGRHLISKVGSARHLMLVLKANAYGHGDHLVLDTARKLGITRLGVGDSHEALAMRERGWEHQLLVLGSLIEEEILSVIKGRIALTVHSRERIQLLDKLTRNTGTQLEVHLKVDTGMGRFGARPEAVAEMARLILEAPGLSWKGICTHFASPTNAARLDQQITVFRETLASLDPLPRGVEVHAAGTMALLRDPSCQFDFVRGGMGIYGLVDEPPFEPVLSLHSQIIFIKDVPSGWRVGYEGTHTCTDQTRMAIIPIGYSDGFRFAFTNRAHMLVRGQRAPVIGRVSMDYTTLDITHIPHAGVGDKVTLIGRDGEGKILVSDWAAWAQTIPHEITCLLGHRVRRVAVD